VFSVQRHLKNHELRFQDRIAPWVHYVPVQVDLSDLYDSLIFFRGNLTGESGHDDMARLIAMAGREWSKRFWRKEDLTAYLFRQVILSAQLVAESLNECNL
jgi:hypothetical protein